MVAMNNAKVSIVATEPKPLVEEFQHEDVAMIFEKEVRCESQTCTTTHQDIFVHNHVSVL